METRKKSLNNLNISVKLINYLTGEQGRLIPLDRKENISDADIKQITSICQRPKIFNLLFAELPAFKGRGYERKDAVHWVNDMGRKGWDNFSNFVYIVRDSQGQIVAGLDIKTPNLENAEVGYWADENHPGWMTNAVISLVEIARSTGFHKLFGLVRKTNSASMRVLKRAEFVEVEPSKEMKKHYKRFEIQL